MAGNPAWADYNVAVDARFLSDAPAVLMGRIDSADNFQDDKALGPSGYALRVNPNGHWELLSTTLNKPVKQIIGGAVNLNQTKWHRLELRFRGKNIKALLDGELLVSTADDAHAHGMIAVGTEWNRIQFDNLAVTKPKD